MIRSLSSLILLVSMSALAQNRGAPPVQPQMPAQMPANVVSGNTSSVDALLTEELIRTLRDPFAPPVTVVLKEAPKTELETIQLKDFRLNGVITGPKKVRAMVTGPGGKTYFVAVGDRLGIRQGRITAIQADLIKVVEYDVDEKGRRTPEIFEVRMTGELVSLSKKEE